MNRTRLLIAPLALLGIAALAGCAEPSTGTAASSSAAAASSSPSASATPTLSGSIIVDAAASLNVVYPKLAASFMALHPGTKITFSFGGSSDLAAGIVSGTPADVFSAASTKTMDTVVAAKKTAATPIVIARNLLEIATPPGNPGKITGLADFGDASKTIVICAKAVPCGAAAQTLFTLAKVDAKPDSYAQNVTAVLTTVETKNADAGLVYQTDVQAAGAKVHGIPIPEAQKAITAYPIAPLIGSSSPALAAAFVAYVVQNGESELQAAGFLAPQ